MIVYGSMDRQTLDAAYNNSAAVADSDRYLADWVRRSEALRARMQDHLNLTYGDAPRARLDFFPANRTGAATLLFFHGGYWQRNTKEGLQRRRRRTARTWLPCCSRRLHTGARG
jgi:arylformamidase